jgi:uncharacterized protein
MHSSLESYRPSRYNVAAKLSNGDWALYNSLTGTRIRIAAGALTAAQASSIERCASAEAEPLTASLHQELISLGFFLPVGVDELAIATGRHYEVARNSLTRRVTVILTRACNLGCVYCYQDKEKKSARDDLQRVQRFLRRQIKSNGLLQITWFGGEPLLRLSVIRQLSVFVQEECAKKGCRYGATMSTNGVRLTETVIKDLKALGLRSVQISLDGPRAIQEKRRPSLKGLPTYDTILANVGLALDRDIEVVIKVIVDKENANHIPELFEDLARQGLLQRLNIAIQETEAKFAASDYGARFASVEEFAKVKLALLRSLSSLGYPMKEPAQRPEFCAATSTFSYVVDLAGTLFRCGTEDVNRTGYVDEEGEDHLTNQSYEEMFTKHKFGCLPSCASCKALPLCGGGCTLAANGLAERDVCSFYRYELKGYLRLLEEPAVSALAIAQAARL